LELAEEQSRYRAHWFPDGANVEGMAQVAEESIPITIGNRISDQIPLDGAYDENKETGVDGGHGISACRVPGIGQTHGRNDLPTYRAAEDDEEDVGLVELLPVYSHGDDV
jgi:hypothetical protein